MGGKLSRDIQALNGKRPRKRNQRTPATPVVDGLNPPQNSPPSLQSDCSSKPDSKSSKTVISGRDFHATQSSSYWLPKDEEEQDRLVGVSFGVYLLSFLFGSLCPDMHANLILFFPGLLLKQHFAIKEVNGG